MRFLQPQLYAIVAFLHFIIPNYIKPTYLYWSNFIYIISLTSLGTIVNIYLILENHTHGAVSFPIKLINQIN